MAKAMEDTAFYRYLPLVSLNEVGGDPRSFGMSVAAFHCANQTRAAPPAALPAGHVHARQQARRGPARAHRRAVGDAGAVGGRAAARWPAGPQLYLTRTTEAGAAPADNDIWLLFQTLVGMWPAQPPDDAAARRPAPARAGLHAQGGARSQAAHQLGLPRTRPTRTRWRATSTACCAPAPNPFADELQKFTARIAPFGFRNSLAQVALKFTVARRARPVPGLRAVELQPGRPGQPPAGGLRARWRATLERAAGAVPPSGCPRRRTGRRCTRDAGRRPHQAAGHLAAAAAAARAAAPLFRDGSYVPLAVRRPGRRTCAWPSPRVHEREAVLVVAARLTWHAVRGRRCALGAAAVAGHQLRAARTPPLRRFRRWRNWLTGAEHRLARRRGAPRWTCRTCSPAAGGLPFAVLVAHSGGRA